MLEFLLRHAAPPPIHTAGTHPLWTDEHIARGMLAAHLDPGTDAASRRPATIEATVAWLAARLPAGARVLDLGCGPGLYARRLAAAGFAVTGVDFSVGSIAHARCGGGPVRYLHGDYRSAALDGPFDAVLLIYLDLGTFGPADIRLILRRVRGWLAPGGIFAFDVATPARRDGSEHRRDWGVAEAGFWSPEPHAWLSRTVRYPDGPTYLDEHVVVTAAETRIYRVWERCFTPASVRAELAAAGLVALEVYADLAGTPHQESSPTLGVLAGRAPAAAAVPPPGLVVRPPRR